MIKKIGSKKHPIETIEFDRQTPKEIDTLPGELVFSYPSEIDESINRILSWISHPQTEHGLTVSEHILRMFEDEAKKLLERNEYSTTLERLEAIEENTMDISSANARAVLFLARQIRQNSKDNDIESLFLNLFKLVTAAIQARLNLFIVSGIRRETEVKPKNRKIASMPRKKVKKIKVEEQIKIKAGEFMAHNSNLGLNELSRKVIAWYGTKKGYSEATIKNLISPLWKEKNSKRKKTP